MKKLTVYETWYGRNEPPPEIIKLNAGLLDVEFENGELRYLSIGKQELIRRVYVAVRDVNWDTIPAQISNQQIEIEEDKFKIDFDVLHREGTLIYRWHARLEGNSDGTLSYSMVGEAESEFRYCRIGFCVLHPIQGIAGRPYRAITPSRMESGDIPRLIEPQRMENGYEAPIFPSCSSVTIDLENGISLTTTFEGDLFEMEDQRNWTDGSFKTYCTPLSLGYPHQAKKGQNFYQKVTITTRLPDRWVRPDPGERIDASRLVIGETTDFVLPKLGFVIPLNQPMMSERQIGLLSDLHPDHLKVEIHLKDPDWQALLNQAGEIARKVGSQLEIALFLENDSQQSLSDFRNQLAGVPFAHIIVFYEPEAATGTTAARWLELTRRYLAETYPDIALIGGTNGNFAELARQPPDTQAMDGVCYTINPQVHAFDERSLIEALEAQFDTVMTARSFCGSLPIIVSSVTLKPPFNVAATEVSGKENPNVLPSTVDSRQMSLFAAAWTTGSIASLSCGGAEAITYYEIMGWKGLFESENGNSLPDHFASTPGMIFPVYWIFEFLAAAKGARISYMKSSKPLFAGGLLLNKENKLWLLASNYLPAPQEIQVYSLPGKKGLVRYLNSDNFEAAASDPDEFKKMGLSIETEHGKLILNLQPYETALVEFQFEKE